jgi:hypothetical protein
VHDLATELQLLENEPRAQRQQHLRTHRPPFGWPGDPPGRSGLPERIASAKLVPENLDIAARPTGSCPRSALSPASHLAARKVGQSQELVTAYGEISWPPLGRSRLISKFGEELPVKLRRE